MVIILLLLYAVVLCHFADPIVKWVFRKATQFAIWPDHYTFRDGVKHGPQTWPWWRVVTVSIVRTCSYRTEKRGWNVWFYTRWGAWCCGIYERVPR